MSTVTSPAPTSLRTTAPGRACGTIPGDQRIAIHGITWELYDRLSRAIGEGQHIRLAYDGKDLEIMTMGRVHEDFKELS
jgi:hypothetical protein